MPRQHNREKQILDWEELETAPNTVGAYSFLRPVAEVISIRGASVGTIKAKKRPYKIHECKSVQGGQSQGETALLVALWNAGKKQQDETALITIGWKEMGPLARMSDKRAKANMTVLIEKLAVEKIADEIMETRTGRTYRVYSFSEILKRRKAVGMNWVIRDKGVRFVDPETGLLLQMSQRLLPTRSTVKPLVKPSTVDKTSIETVDITSTVPLDDLSTETVDVMSTPLRSLLRKQQEVKTSSSERSLMMQALADYGRPDNEAVEQLWRRCREICPDAAVEEVVALIHDKGLHIARNRGITSPIGFLLTSVPKCFHVESITELRRQLAREREAATARKEEEIRREREYVAMLRADHESYVAVTLDPSAAPDKVRRAETMLASIVPELKRYDLK